MPIRALLVIFLFVGHVLHASTQVHTEDVIRFWNAYDRIQATTDTALQRHLLHVHFFDPASAGQRGMFAARRCTPDDYLHAIRNYPRFWASVRGGMMRAAEHARTMVESAARFKELYPVMRPADIYFTVGVLRSGGTVYEGMVLIGSELALGEATTVTDELPEELGHLPAYFASNRVADLAFTNVHELVHTQQAGRWGYDLLSQSLHEGVAEFVATLALDIPSPSPCVSYGEQHQERVRAVFEEELFAYWIDRWIWNDTLGPFPARDLGYYVGFAMARAHHQRSTDKSQALAELIGLNCEDRAAVEAFADRCGWLSRPLSDLRTRFEAARPKVIGVREFENGATAVDPRTATITVLFDRPMNTHYRSTGEGTRGTQCATTVRNIQFAEDGRSVTYTVSLTPGQCHQFILEEGYRDERLFQLVPYQVEFTTADQ